MGVMAAPLITAAELVAEMAGNSAAQPLVLDVRWTLAGSDENAYRQGHIPGALFVDLDAELAGPPGAGGRHPLPDPEALQRLWQELGIDEERDVIVYDARDASVAARAWWLLRWSGLPAARVLDGGYAAWLGAGGASESGPVQRPGGGRVQVRPGGMPIVDIDGAAGAAGQADRILLDARAAPRYRGEVEPIDPVAGHIPGAVNLPLTELLDPDGTFQPPERIRARFAEAGVRAGDTPVASCGSGVTACHLILAAELVGIAAALYPGSFSGWCAAGRPVAVG